VSDTETGLGQPPSHAAEPKAFADFIGRGFGIPHGYQVSQVVRHGGRNGTGLVVHIAPPGGGRPLRIQYAKESDCTNPVKLRAQAAGDTRGLTRGTLINSPKAALAMYEALCSMADLVEAIDEDAEVWEWLEHLERVAATTVGAPHDHAALKRLQGYDYSKRLVLDPPDGARIIPMVLLDDRTGDRYISARHMAVFLRYDIGIEDVGSYDQIVTRLDRVGGKRVVSQVWNGDRSDKVTLVLYRLPNPANSD
jgi:hypothetical protein